MWGYIAPPALKKGSQPSFLGYYCALCHALWKDYGLLAQQTLSYDCAFMAMLIGGVYQEGAQAGRRCVMHPFSKRPVAPIAEAAHFAAAANVLLTANKCRDDWNDERSLKGRAGLALLGGAERRARRKYPEMARLIELNLEALSQCERSGCAQMDEAAHAFATLLGGMMALAGRGAHESEPLGGLGYNLGKWIYLLDAWDDMEKDQSKSSYNVLLRQFRGQSVQDIRALAYERVQWNLSHTLHEARCAAELMVLGEKRAAVDQVLAGICPARQEAVLGGKELVNA